MSNPSIRIEGNILSSEILELIASGEAVQQQPKDFGFAPGVKVKDEVAKAWADTKSLYQIFRRRMEEVPESESGVQETRRFWMILFFELLGYHLERTDAEIVAGKSYAISHRASNLDHFPVIVMGFNQKLDKKPGTGLRMSPHAVMQEYLNLTEHLYGIVTNGIYLRLLRDSSRLTKLSYLEFNLVQMMEEGLYADFALLFRTLHASRMPQRFDQGDMAVIETYHQDALESGARIRANLSKAVEHSILKMANGFLAELQNQGLRDWARETKNSGAEYYDWLLKLIYRLLFLMVIEERNLVFPEPEKEASKAEHQRWRKIYYDYYSVNRLRRLSEKPYFANEKYFDLWDGLLLTFRLFQPGANGDSLGIAPLGGALFNAAAIGALARNKLNNKIVLECIRRLNQFYNAQGQRIRVNYASLDVEEFGSVYEGLLEYEPVINSQQMRFTFEEGSGRSSSGSHYTPDELVQPLIKHSLDHLIEERLSPAGGGARRAGVDIEQALLSLKVCDVACGSGHILLAAARRIGLALARVRTGEDQPAPTELRKATREAIQHCIYGVDKNPLAVELCKVALWLEAHDPGQPLNFLDHKIKCGDAIVGLANQEELERGIPDEAFKTLPGDDKEVAKLLRTANKRERQDREQGQLTTAAMLEVEESLKSVRRLFDEFNALPERTPEEIEEKAKYYQKLTAGKNWWRLKELADVQVAQFFIPKTDADVCVTDRDYQDFLSGRAISSQKIGKAVGVAEEKRFFHWFLEFPEVFAAGDSDRRSLGEGGFDCILGNPPFLGGLKLSTTFGYPYMHYLHSNFHSAGGTCDLVAYFFRRNFTLIHQQGFISLISTNTIAQGDTRKGGLEVILSKGGDINHAFRSMRWPGQAAVEVALVTIFKGKWEDGDYFLDKNKVAQITSYLDDSIPLDDPYKLKQNEHKSFIGSYVLGKGFVLEPEEAQVLIQKKPKNKEVLFPYLNGDDLNNRPDQSPSRWVINFFDWEEEYCRKNYPDCFEIVERLVKPLRMSDNRAGYRKYWWQYAEKRLNLYPTIALLGRILVINRHTKNVAFGVYSNRYVFSEATVVFALERWFEFSFVSSSLHDIWAWKFSSTMGSGTLRYSGSDAFETFPFPQSPTTDQKNHLELIGETYHEHRRKLMLDIQLGLTKTYNQFHNPGLAEMEEELSQAEAEKRYGKETLYLWKHLEKTEGTIPFNEAVGRILHLRELHREMDEAVLAAYGWHESTGKWGPAIRLEHGFYEVDYLPENDRVRYTISPAARKEVLKRLLLLNHEVYEEERKAGGHGGRKKGGKKKKKVEDDRQGKLF